MLHVIERKQGKQWLPVSAHSDGRVVHGYLVSYKWQFPKDKFRKAIYVRQDKDIG